MAYWNNSREGDTARTLQNVHLFFTPLPIMENVVENQNNFHVLNPVELNPFFATEFFVHTSHSPKR